jgi:NADPH-dependent ferric siderophore reductase
MPSTTSTVRGTRRARGARDGMRYLRARVIGINQLSPNVRRATLVGADLCGLPFGGADQRIKLLLPLAGQDRPQIEGLSTIWDVLALPEAVRPIIRTYTIRHHRPGACEVDIDFAQHGDFGPATRWAMTAQPGDEVALFGPVADHAPPEDTRWQLLVGDETALPAIGAIIESLRHYERARVLIEIDDPRDEQVFDTAGTVEITWLHRLGAAAHQSSRLLNAVSSVALPAVPSYFWIAGEAWVATSIRRYLVNERGVDRDDIVFSGYWRYGQAEN